jgi:hypothetical protein
MPRGKDQYEAWIIGTHELPPTAALMAGGCDIDDVLVHNITRDTYRVLSLAQFTRQFEMT